MLPSMIIRLASEDDLAACGVIYADAFTGPPYDEDWAPTKASAMLAELLKKDPESCWCVEEGGEVCGFAFCTSFGKFRALIQEFAVHPKVQKKGIGTALMKHILAEFQVRGIMSAELVVNKHAPAFDLYKRFGFHVPRNYTLMIRTL